MRDGRQDRRCEAEEAIKKAPVRMFIIAMIALVALGAAYVIVWHIGGLNALAAAFAGSLIYMFRVDTYEKIGGRVKRGKAFVFSFGSAFLIYYAWLLLSGGN